METRRTLALVTGALLLAVLWLSTGLLPAGAYDNATSHQVINRAAVAKMVERMKQDDWLENASLDGEPAVGLEVSELGLLNIGQRETMKPVADWIAHGGLSADEPELYMSFRHFFDPIAVGGSPWLTDHLDDILAISPVEGNPEVTAREWAISHPDNKYNWNQAKAYLESALHDTETKPGAILDYGKAWRGVGETMHLVADMTVPAHVRNDSHPYLLVRSYKLGDPDPYESTTFGDEAAEYVNGEPSPAIDYTLTDVDKLLLQVATWTNRNFLSEHTIPRWAGAGKTANGQPEYPAPKIPEKVEGNYYYRDVDGTTTFLARKSALTVFGLIRNAAAVPLGTLDQKVIRAQRARLIPTAVEASASVLDAFLPRFRVVVSKVEPDPSKQGDWLLYGRLEHKATPLWPTQPAVNNGAFVIVNGGKPAVIGNGKGIVTNGVSSYSLTAKDGDHVQLGYDLGGYKLLSEPVKIGSLVVDPPKATVETGEAQQFTALRAGKATSEVIWGVGPSPAGGSITDRGLYTAPDKPGAYTVVATDLTDRTRRATAKVEVKLPALVVLPASITLAPGETVTFAATLAGKPVPVKWKVQEGAAGGTIADSGLYTAPSATGTYHVVATSQADPASQVAATVTVRPAAPTPTPKPGSAKPQGMQNVGVSILDKMTFKEGKRIGSTNNLTFAEKTGARELAVYLGRPDAGRGTFTWSGNAFTATTESNAGGIAINSTVDGEVDEAGRKIVRLRVTYAYKSNAHRVEYKMGWEGRDIPFAREESDLYHTSLVYELTGAAAAGHVSDLSYLHREWYTDMAGDKILGDQFRRELIAAEWGDPGARLTVRIHSNGPQGKDSVPGYGTKMAWPK